MARVVRFDETGGPEVLRFEDLDVGEPGPGEVRIRHVAVGLNFADTYFRRHVVDQCRKIDVQVSEKIYPLIVLPL